MRGLSRGEAGHAESVASGYGFTQGAQCIPRVFSAGELWPGLLESAPVFGNLQPWISRCGLRALDLADRPAAGYA